MLMQRAHKRRAPSMQRESDLLSWVYRQASFHDGSGSFHLDAHPLHCAIMGPTSFFVSVLFAVTLIIASASAQLACEAALSDEFNDTTAYDIMMTASSGSRIGDYVKG